MQKICHPALVVSVIFAIVLSACGREVTSQQSKMSESQAFERLANIPMEQSRGAFGKKGASQGLKELILKLVAEGKIKVPAQGRGAVASTTPDLTPLTNILDLITSGKATNIFSLATALISQASGNGAPVKFDLSFIIGILNSALPIVMLVAPQFAGIIQALLVILPVVISFINMFFPSATPTPSPAA